MTARTGRCSSAGHNVQTASLRRSIISASLLLLRLTDTAVATGPAKLQIRVSYMDSQQKSGFP